MDQKLVYETDREYTRHETIEANAEPQNEANKLLQAPQGVAFPRICHDSHPIGSTLQQKMYLTSALTFGSVVLDE